MFYWKLSFCMQSSLNSISRDVVLEASASARGGLEAVFLAGSASPRPHTVSTLLPRPRLCLIVSASVLKVAPYLGSVVSVNLRERPPTELKFNVTHRDFAYF